MGILSYSLAYIHFHMSHDSLYRCYHMRNCRFVYTPVSRYWDNLRYNVVRSSHCIPWDTFLLPEQ